PLVQSLDLLRQVLIQRLELAAAMRGAAPTARTRAAPGRHDSTACDRAADRGPARSRAARSARASACGPPDGGAGVMTGDPGTPWTASRSPETAPLPAAAATRPHRGDRVSAGASPPSESPWDAPRDTQSRAPQST